MSFDPDQSSHPERVLAGFAASLNPEQIPEPVLTRAEELFLDWAASALAGKGAEPVEHVAALATMMAPGAGPSEVLMDRSRRSPALAAAVNAAASHYLEQDDVHNGAVFHPGSVVFPVALALAQAERKSGLELLTAAVAGYEVGIRAGEFLGLSHYKVFHTTATVGTLAAAATAGHLLGLDRDQMLHAFGSAGTQSAGLWEFLRDGADSKQIHTFHACLAGLSSAWLAQRGMRGAQRILTGTQGMAAGMSRDADPARLTDRLGQRWTLAETSFKYHASCRHTHPAADALLKVMQEHDLRPADVRSVTARVHQAAIDVLGRVTVPGSVHQAKFSMGTTLGLLACHGHAGVDTFEHHYKDPEVMQFASRVRMELDADVEAAYPQVWLGRVVVDTTDGRQLSARVDQPRGDPGNTLDRATLADKAQRLARHRQAASPEEVDALVAMAWSLRELPVVGALLPGSNP